MIDSEMEVLIQAAGIHVHKGERLEIDIDAKGCMGLPAISVWASSEEFSEDDISLLGDMAVMLFRRVGKTPGLHSRRFGIDPVLVRKKDQRWQFRRASWDEKTYDWAGNTPTLVEMLPQI